MSSNRLNTLLEMYDANNPDSFILFAIAKEYHYLNDLSNSIAYFLQLKTVDAQYVGLYYHLGKAYEENEQPELALSIYEEGIQQAKKQADFHALSELMNAKTNLEMEL